VLKIMNYSVFDFTFWVPPFVGDFDEQIFRE